MENDEPKCIPYRMVEGIYIEDEWMKLHDYPEPPDEREIIAEKESREEWERYRNALKRFSDKQKLFNNPLLLKDKIIQKQEELIEFLTSLGVNSPFRADELKYEKLKKELSILKGIDHK